jgi:hypothetical protein
VLSTANSSPSIEKLDTCFILSRGYALRSRIAPLYKRDPFSPRLLHQKLATEGERDFATKRSPLACVTHDGTNALTGGEQIACEFAAAGNTCNCVPGLSPNQSS